MPPKMWKQVSKKRLLVIIFSIALVGIVAGLGLRGLLGGMNHNTIPGGTFTGTATPGQGTAISLTPNTPVSPLLFGTNLSLFDGNDQVLNSSGARTMLSQMHTRIIRMPVRSSLSESVEVQAAQAIKDLGAIPLVILRGAVDEKVIADDMRMINDMNRIFGKSVVYYEYGNEEDLLGVDVNGYTASWNAVVPRLKHLALNGDFIGPVNYQYDRNYLVTFLQQANPRPNEISWHEYTCDDSWSDTLCISHIDRWTDHIADARAAMQSTIGTVLPIMITEWNYAPNAVPNDGKNNDPAFMSTWTTKALQVLAANRVFASMQYSCTNTAIPLITSGGAATAQGLIFQNQYQSMIVKGQQPPPAQGGIAQGGSAPTPAPSTGSGQPSTFSFEDGTTDGWSSHSATISLQNSATIGYQGKHSLEATLTNVNSNDYPNISVGSSGATTFPRAGQTISLYVYLPSNSVSVGAEIFVMDGAYHWLSPNTITRLSPGTWNHLTFTLPTSTNGQVHQVGIQFSNLSTLPMSTNVFVDAVGWA